MLAGAALVEVGDLGLVTSLVVAVAQVRQQPGAANGAVLQAGIALLDRPQVDRVIAQGLFIELEWSHGPGRSEEHTSELQSLMRISYAVFCLKNKNKKQQN